MKKSMTTRRVIEIPATCVSQPQLFQNTSDFFLRLKWSLCAETCVPITKVIGFDRLCNVFIVVLKGFVRIVCVGSSLILFMLVDPQLFQ